MENKHQTPRKPPGDLKKFWRTHDRNLKKDLAPSQVHLSHNLYRGMPGWFNAFFDHFQRRIIREWAQACRIQPGMVSLDIGCGTGRWIGLMMTLNQKATGMDLGFNAIHFARNQWGRAQFVQGKLPFLCFAPETFHWAVSVTVLQHLSYEDQGQSLKEIHRLLKPGGYFMLCESMDLKDQTDYIFPNSIAEWGARFHQTGFEVIDQRGCEFLPLIKGFHWVRDRLVQKSTSDSPWNPKVSEVAAYLENKPSLAFFLRLSWRMAYPLEYMAGRFFPANWARLACFLLRKV